MQGLMVDREWLPAEQAPDATSGEPEPLDMLLLNGYTPATSLAWAGAAPRGGTWMQQLQFWDDVGTDDEGPVGDPAFHAGGFDVRPIRGCGAAAIVETFLVRHHYLRSAGMNGTRLGLYSPADELVGVAVFAPCSNPRAAAGMQCALPGDEYADARELAHVKYGPREMLDCVRLALVDRPDVGTGAESHLYASCLRYFAQRNREVWRAVRMAELGWPLPRTAAQHIATGTPFCKVVRSFSEPQRGPGAVYTATGAWDLGLTRVESTWVGRRSGRSITRRARSKLLGEGSGHLNQCLLAVWEGGTGHATAVDRSTGVVRGQWSLAAMRDEVTFEDSPSRQRAALARAWKRQQAQWAATLGLPLSSLVWCVEADDQGYDLSKSAAKRRWAHFLGPKAISDRLAARCVHLPGLRTALAAWCAEEPRWPRGLGYGRRRPPASLGRARSSTAC